MKIFETIVGSLIGESIGKAVSMKVVKVRSYKCNWGTGILSKPSKVVKDTSFLIILLILQRYKSLLNRVSESCMSKKQQSKEIDP